jgi:hypothetical protein
MWAWVDIERELQVECLHGLDHQLGVAGTQLVLAPIGTQQLAGMRPNTLSHGQTSVAPGVDEREIDQRRHRLPQIEFPAEHPLGLLDRPGVGEYSESGEQLALVSLEERDGPVERGAQSPLASGHIPGAPPECVRPTGQGVDQSLHARHTHSGCLHAPVRSPDLAKHSVMVGQHVTVGITDLV